jgi:transcriptional regulator with XRE-family HTH domain
VTRTQEFPVGEAFDGHIGKVLRRVRKDRGLSLRRVAELSEGRFTPTTIAGYERGERSISTARLVSLARIYGTPADRLVAQAVRASAGLPSIALDRYALQGARSHEAHVVRAYVRSLDRLRSGPKRETVAIREGDLEVVAMSAGVDPASFGAALRSQGVLREVQPSSERPGQVPS